MPTSFHRLFSITLAAILSFCPSAPGFSYVHSNSVYTNTRFVGPEFETEAFSPRAAWVRNYVRDCWGASFDFFERFAEKVNPLLASGTRISSRQHSGNNIPSGAEIWRPDNIFRMSRIDDSNGGGDAIATFQNSVPYEYKHLASNEKAQKLYDRLGSEAVSFIQESLTNASISRKTTEGSVLILAAHLTERYFEADPTTEAQCLDSLSKLFEDLYPKRFNQKEIANWVARRDAATADQRTLKDAMCRTLSIPSDRVIFVDPNDEWLMSFFGLSGRSLFGPSRHANGMHRLLYENEGTAPEKLILILADRSDFETLQILAHEGSHWSQSEEMLTDMHDNELPRFLGEGFQRYREFAGLSRMAKDPVAGKRVQELVDEAFTVLKNPPGVASFDEKLWVTINLHSSAAYATETALVRTLVARIGIGRMLAYFLTGNREVLASALNDKSMELLENFCVNWRFGFVGTFDVRQRVISMAMALHFASMQNVGDEQLRRLNVVLKEINSFMDDVIQKERIAHSLFDCFDPHLFLPLLDAFMAGHISDETFHRQLFHDLRSTAARSLKHIQLNDWFPDLYKIDALPNASALFPSDNSGLSASSARLTTVLGFPIGVPVGETILQRTLVYSHFFLLMAAGVGVTTISVFVQDDSKLFGESLLTVPKWWQNHGANLFGAFWWSTLVYLAVRWFRYGLGLNRTGTQSWDEQVELKSDALLAAGIYLFLAAIREFLQQDVIDFFVELSSVAIFLGLTLTRIFTNNNDRNDRQAEDDTHRPTPSSPTMTNDRPSILRHMLESA